MRSFFFRGPRQGHYEPNASYLDRLVKYYGVTDNPMLGGFILPDGSFLDFSEGSGSRSQDHRNITWASIVPEKDREGRYDVMERICKRVGMYRWKPETWGIDAWMAPTSEQMFTLRALFQVRPPILDLTKGRYQFYREYEDFDAPRAASDLLRFYGGVDDRRR